MYFAFPAPWLEVVGQPGRKAAKCRSTAFSAFVKDQQRVGIGQNIGKAVERAWLFSVLHIGLPPFSIGAWSPLGKDFHSLFLNTLNIKTCSTKGVAIVEACLPNDSLRWNAAYPHGFFQCSSVHVFPVGVWPVGSP